jgi:predicted NUDIX family NTP pyrophosphohydrolase
MSATRTSAGLMMYRGNGATLEVFLVHPGGPFFRNKDEGFWGIPKGLPDEGEDLFDAARREFSEETGFPIPPGAEFIPLGQVKQKAGKVVHGWAFEGDCDPAMLKCNTMRIQYPPGSGKWITAPEVDKGAFFTVNDARVKINSAQAAFLDRLVEALGGKS